MSSTVVSSLYVNKPSVIFIDEIDALATRRQGIFKETTYHLYNAATQERETTLNQLLIEVELCICRIPAMKFT
ncbi:hypothetical protein ES319_A10G120700v1 [Gossypium barbadense]|uniref:ATPase AAA-type core domain-containing protein n=1 Tax=Gossypium barbadense TaxID=3634 RepID=A0A5J5U1Z5_GOSBA|nr:hypothetical protein ES319_A10G120700v1 [Gossypium barbadense]